MTPAPAQEPAAQHRSPGDTAVTWTIGDLVVHRVHETDLAPPTGAWLLPRATPDVVAGAPWLRPSFAGDDGVLRLTTHSFAFETDGQRVLIDTGIGNAKTRTNPAWDGLDTPYLHRLTAAGFPPEEVDLVILTHLHTDHVGWNTRLSGGAWTPTFPRARYLTSRTEWDHWAGVDLEDSRRQMFEDSIHPVRDSGQLDLVDVPEEGAGVAPGVRLLPVPGHTPGQVAVELRSGTRSALISGDCVHHPVQLVHPDISSCVDIDAAQAERTRRDLLVRLAGTGTLLLGSHFPPPTAGLVRAEGTGFRLDPVPGEPGPAPEAP